MRCRRRRGLIWLDRLRLRRRRGLRRLWVRLLIWLLIWRLRRDRRNARWPLGG